MEISLGKRKIEINPFVTKIKEDSGISGATLYSEVGGDAGINGSLGVALVDRDAGINVGGVIADTKGDAGINGSLGVALVDGDVKINVGGVIADTKELSDYKVKDVYKRITKYLPQFIQQIDLPAFNIGGVYTETGEMGLKNSCVLGLFNNIVDTDEDYIALGIINRIKYKEKDGEKRVKYGLLCSGRVHIDGIFSHREKESNLEKKVD